MLLTGWFFRTGNSGDRGKTNDSNKTLIATKKIILICILTLLDNKSSTVILFKGKIQLVLIKPLFSFKLLHENK